MATRRPYKRAAKARWPRAGWIHGEGRWATVAPCRDYLTVELHATRAAAEVSMLRLRQGCGGFCTPDAHSLVDLGPPPGA
jgi:hypothetical protein